MLTPPVIRFIAHWAACKVQRGNLALRRHLFASDVCSSPEKRSPACKQAVSLHEPSAACTCTACMLAYDSHLGVELDGLCLQPLLLHSLCHFLQTTTPCDVEGIRGTTRRRPTLGCLQASTHPQLLCCHAQAASLCVVLHSIVECPQDICIALKFCIGRHSAALSVRRPVNTSKLTADIPVLLVF